MALHIAARHHNVEIGKLLAEHGADVNSQNVRCSAHLKARFPLAVCGNSVGIVGLISPTSFFSII